MNVVLLGKAKTGTTASAMAIASALPDCRVVMEPKDLGFLRDERRTFRDLISSRARVKHRVVKIIFEHWRGRHDELKDLICDRSALKVDRVVVITRDPRDELISRLHYGLYNHLLNHANTDPSAVEAWIELMRCKERDPGGVTVLSMLTRYDELLRPHVRPRRAFARYASVFESFVESLDGACHRLRYEDFVQGKWDALSGYLGFRPLNADVGKSLQRVSRTRTAGQWKQFFTPDDLCQYRKTCGAHVARLGYDDWELEPVSSLNPQEHSDYLVRLRDEALSTRQDRRRAR